MTPLLALQDVSVSYRNGRMAYRVFRNASLEINPGEVIAVWGMRRSGKTTLANVAAGLIEPDRGRVLFDEHELPTPRRLQRQRPHKDIALVHFGQPHGPTGRRTVVDHIGRCLQRKESVRFYKRWSARRDYRYRAYNALELLGLRDYASERWERLANRERGLVAVTEALISLPRLLILDDFGLGVDPIERDSLYRLLRNVVAESSLSVLLITESASGLFGVDRVASLANGELMLAEPRPGAQVIGFPTRKRSA